MYYQKVGKMVKALIIWVFFMVISSTLLKGQMSKIMQMQNAQNQIPNISQVQNSDVAEAPQSDEDVMSEIFEQLKAQNGGEMSPEDQEQIQKALLEDIKKQRQSQPAITPEQQEMLMNMMKNNSNNSQQSVDISPEKQALIMQALMGGNNVQQNSDQTGNVSQEQQELIMQALMGSMNNQ